MTRDIRITVLTREISTMVVHVLPKDETRVRFSYLAPNMIEQFDPELEPTPEQLKQMETVLQQSMQFQLEWAKNIELPLEQGDYYVKPMQALAQHFDLNPETIYYPCCRTDISPSIAFPTSRVEYVDFQDNVVNALQRANLSAHNASALEFNPGEVDMLIMLMPQVLPDVPSQFVKPGGHAIVNNFYRTAKCLDESGQFELIGVASPWQKDGDPVKIIDNNLERYQFPNPYEDNTPENYRLFLFRKLDPSTHE